MKFDPVKPYMTVYGLDPAFPGAKYQQGNFVYNAAHVIVGGDDPNENVTPTQKSKKDLIAKLTKNLGLLTSKLEEAQTKYDHTQTTQTKATLSKALNKYEVARDELSDLVE